MSMHSQARTSLPKPFLIGGEWVHDTPTCLTSINPATGEINFEVCAATEAHVDAAVKSAKAAFATPLWQKMLPHSARAMPLQDRGDHSLAWRRTRSFAND